MSQVCPDAQPGHRFVSFVRACVRACVRSMGSARWGTKILFFRPRLGPGPCFLLFAFAFCFLLFAFCPRWSPRENLAVQRCALAGFRPCRKKRDFEEERWMRWEITFVMTVCDAESIGVVFARARTPNQKKTVSSH